MKNNYFVLLLLMQCSGTGVSEYNSGPMTVIVIHVLIPCIIFVC